MFSYILVQTNERRALDRFDAVTAFGRRIIEDAEHKALDTGVHRIVGRYSELIVEADD